MIESIYTWLWSYWGAITLGGAVSVICLLIGFYVLEEGYSFSGLYYFGLVLLFSTIIFGVVWALASPFSIHWILIPIGVVVLLPLPVALSGNINVSNHWDINEEVVTGAVITLVAIGLSYLVAFHPGVRTFVTPDRVEARWAGVQVQVPELPMSRAPRVAPTPPRPLASAASDPGWIKVGSNTGSRAANGRGGSAPPVRRAAVTNLWPDSVSASSGGYLVAAGNIPIRALAAGYTVPLFETQNTEFPRGVMGTMRPFFAYYVVRKEGEALLLAERSGAPLPECSWARQGECYIWTTGQLITVAPNAAVYPSESDARSRSRPLSPTAAYADVGRLRRRKDESSALPGLSQLPLMSQAADVGSFLSPSRGGQLIWVNLVQEQGRGSVSILMSTQ